ncbi:hypothetical protein PBCV1_a384R [Paramecium bursaria Chlorella virus 1]|uniref:Uncharacterized protein n=1 Tax=Paramecium bursaria Chlorella virus 1 TaxID=10506 RepID=F8TU26_PBCV1|nr:hypothetical protein PBCV1_a384R [Paramecium bursaria Chlorella virus 1]AEI70087.1 hypothetical protein [Paramecium bursaria Chlorella virus 1]
MNNSRRAPVNIFHWCNHISILNVRIRSAPTENLIFINANLGVTRQLKCHAHQVSFGIIRRRDAISPSKYL